MEAAGVENVSNVHQLLPVGWGHPETSTLTITYMKLIFDSLKPQMWVALGISDDEYDAIKSGAIREMESESEEKMYFNLYSVWGRKRLD